MDWFDAAWDFCSDVVGYVTDAFSSACTYIVESASTLVKIAGPYLNSISSIIQTIGILFDVITVKDNPEELGAKAMQAEKTPENFDNNAKFIDYLRNEVKLDHKKFDNPSPEEKAARTAVGASIIARGIEEKKGFDIPLTTWLSLARLKLDKNTDAKEVNTILDTFKEDKLTDFSDYVEGKLDTNKELEVGDTLVNMYQELEPTLSKAEIEQKVIQMEKGTL